MRFVLGACIGAVMTLWVATMFDAPTRALVARGGDFFADGGSVWNRFFLNTGKAVSPTTEAGEPTPVSVAFRTQPDPPAEPLAAPAERVEQTPQAEQQERAAHAGQAKRAAEHAGQDDNSTISEATENAQAMQPLPELPSPSRVATHEELLPAQHGTAAVWVPFRSQLSAQGFAARLTAQTQHPFSVTRRGPGRYQVHYTYANEAQREQLAQRIRAATGEATQ